MQDNGAHGYKTKIGGWKPPIMRFLKDSVLPRENFNICLKRVVSRPLSKNAENSLSSYLQQETHSE